MNRPEFNYRLAKNEGYIYIYRTEKDVTWMRDVRTIISMPNYEISPKDLPKVVTFMDYLFMEIPDEWVKYLEDEPELIGGCVDE